MYIQRRTKTETIFFLEKTKPLQTKKIRGYSRVLEPQKTSRQN
jgi:hypothetical protein